MKKYIFFFIFMLVNLSAWAQKYTKTDTLTVRKTQAKLDSLNLQPRIILRDVVHLRALRRVAGMKIGGLRKLNCAA